MTNIFIVSYSYIAALIGAGFASGQEILCYFNSFGRYGFFGIILSCLIFTIFAACVLLVCVRFNINDFNDFLASVCSKRMRFVTKTAAGLFSFAVFSVMLSAAGEIGRIITGISPGICSLLCAAICAVLFCTGTKKVLDFNGIIGLILTAGIITCCLYILRYRDHHVFSGQAQAYANAAIYSGYNLIPAAPVLVTLSRRLRKRADAVSASIISGTAFTLLTSLIFVILEIYNSKINLGEFPMLTLAYRQSNMFAFIYLMMFSGAVATTLFSSGAAIAETFELKKYGIFLFVSAGYLAAGAGFGRLIDTAYRICGIAGFIITLYITLACIKKLIKAKNVIDVF